MTNERWSPIDDVIDHEFVQLTSTDLDELEDAYDEIIRLQERVRALERANEQPQKGFWIELIFNAFLFAAAVLELVNWFGR